MGRIILTLWLLSAFPVCGADLASRIGQAKQAVETDEGAKYMDSLEPQIASATKICGRREYTGFTGGADFQSFDLVGYISSEGIIKQVEVQPATPLSNCYLEKLEKEKFPPPPKSTSENGFPITVHRYITECKSCDVPVKEQQALSTVPSVIFSSCKRPGYPKESIRAEETGTVILKLLISEQGRAIDTVILSSSGHPRLDNATTEAFKRCSYKPAMINGVPKEEWTKITYVWNID